jgi:hypothetical protein
MERVGGMENFHSLYQEYFIIISIDEFAVGLHNMVAQLRLFPEVTLAALFILKFIKTQTI